jgi:hypothetical protein
MSYVKDSGPGRPVRWVVYTGTPKDYPYNTIVGCYSTMFFAKRAARRAEQEKPDRIVWQSGQPDTRQPMSPQGWLRLWWFLLACNLVFLAGNVTLTAIDTPWMAIAVIVSVYGVLLCSVNIRRRRRRLRSPDYDVISRLEREIFKGES